MLLQHASDPSVVEDLMGGGPTGRGELYRMASPLALVTPAAAPHLLAHGNADDIVLPGHSTAFAAALHAAGVEVRLLELPGIGHDGHTLYGAEEVKSEVLDFFTRHLNP